MYVIYAIGITKREERNLSVFLDLLYIIHMFNCISISYKKAPLDVRERVTIQAQEIESFYRNVKGHAVLVSTCNRLEIYFDIDIPEMEIYLAVQKNTHREELLPYIRLYTGQRAIRHLIRVACGIDSMVLGEDEILRQIKEAYYRAHELHKTNKVFNTIFQMVIRASKDIKTNTGLSTTPVSIGTLAANEVFHFPKEKKVVLLMGITGDIGTIIAKNIIIKPGITLMGTIRRHSSPLFQTYPQIQMKDFKDRYQLVNEADVIISATTSPHYTITCKEYETKVTVDKPRLFIDVSVPGNIDKNIKAYPNCRLIDMDGFQELSKRNNELKKQYAQSAEEAVLEWTEVIEKELRMYDLIQILPRLQEDMDEKGLFHVLFSMRKLTNYEQMNQIIAWLEAYIKE